MFEITFSALTATRTLLETVAEAAVCLALLEPTVSSLSIGAWKMDEQRFGFGSGACVASSGPHVCIALRVCVIE